MALRLPAFLSLRAAPIQQGVPLTCCLDASSAETLARSSLSRAADDLETGQAVFSPMPALSRPGPRMRCRHAFQRALRIGAGTPRAVPRSLQEADRNPTRRLRPRRANGIPPYGCHSGMRRGEDRRGVGGRGLFFLDGHYKAAHPARSSRI